MNPVRREDFLAFVGAYLAGLLLLTLGLAAVAGLSPLQLIHPALTDLAIGAAAAGIMVAAFGFLPPVRQQAEEILGPSLAVCRWYDFIPLAVLVGLIEELLFRGVLEPWLARDVSPRLAFWSVNLLFGLLHAVSVPYAVVAGLLGCLLSLLAHEPGEFNLFRPIVAHAVYDYIGFIWIAGSFRRQQDRQASRRSALEDPPDEN